MPFELRIALRYLTARRKQAFISVISAISILGVLVGVAAVMIALGLMTGLQSEIRARILGATAHVSIFKAHNEPFDNYTDVAEAARRVPGVLGTAPAVYGKGLLKSPGGSSQVATLKGIVPDRERTVTDVATQIETASLTACEPRGGGLRQVALGRDLAASLGVGVGDVVSLIAAQGQLTPMGVLPRTTKLQVAGTVRSGLYEFDAAWAYLPFATAQRLFDLE